MQRDLAGERDEVVVAATKSGVGVDLRPSMRRPCRCRGRTICNGPSVASRPPIFRALSASSTRSSSTALSMSPPVSANGAPRSPSSRRRAGRESLTWAGGDRGRADLASFSWSSSSSATDALDGAGAPAAAPATARSRPRRARRPPRLRTPRRRRRRRRRPGRRRGCSTLALAGRSPARGYSPAPSLRSRRPRAAPGARGWLGGGRRRRSGAHRSVRLRGAWPALLPRSPVHRRGASRRWLATLAAAQVSGGPHVGASDPGRRRNRRAKPSLEPRRRPAVTLRRAPPRRRRAGGLGLGRRRLGRAAAARGWAGSGSGGSLLGFARGCAASWRALRSRPTRTQGRRTGGRAGLCGTCAAGVGIDVLARGQAVPHRRR